MSIIKDVDMVLVGDFVVIIPVKGKTVWYVRPPLDCSVCVVTMLKVPW